MIMTQLHSECTLSVCVIISHPLMSLFCNADERRGLTPVNNQNMNDTSSIVLYLLLYHFYSKFPLTLHLQSTHCVIISHKRRSTDWRSFTEPWILSTYNLLLLANFRSRFHKEIGNQYFGVIYDARWDLSENNLGKVVQSHPSLTSALH